MSTKQNIVGRFAPSPTGAMHLGNFRTALIAWLHARSQGGTFRLRMEDLDQPRVVKGSADQILVELDWLGLDWDGDVMYQSNRTQAYQEALDKLISAELIYPCFCSRRDIQQAASAPHGSSPVYPGTCSTLSSGVIIQQKSSKQAALRVRVFDDLIAFDDGCLGFQSEQLSQTCGDFVVKRADGLFAYQLAVIVDDLVQGVTHVVRGSDLLDSTARQIYIASQLDSEMQAPSYFHVPLMRDKNGQKLSKRDGSMSVEEWKMSRPLADRSSGHLLAMLAKSIGLPVEHDVVSSQELVELISFNVLLTAITK